jgi:tRNA-specific 2-thiouridylase
MDTSESIAGAIPDEVHPERSVSERVVLAMSGGVDSCAAGVLLHQQGFQVIGISMQVWDYRSHGGNAKRATCCAPSDFDDARQIADTFGFPFYVFDFEDSFRKNVIDVFVNTYLEGETPNPCLECNRKVKFHELRNRALMLGAKKVATGHYARIRTKADGSKGLYTSRDLNKDQSYFLYALTQEELDTTLFPVGDMYKPEVRTILEQEGFPLSSKPESQDICFVSSSVSEFIQKKGGEVKKGDIRTSDGAVLGSHEGIYNYTVGQRKGLGISNPTPLYVLSIVPEDNAVVVGQKEELKRESFRVSKVHWIRGDWPRDASGNLEQVRARVKLRYRHQGVLCDIRPGDHPDTAEIRFVDEWSTVSPGQAAVFYAANDEEDGAVEVLGGGILERNG